MTTEQSSPKESSGPIMLEGAEPDASATGHRIAWLVLAISLVASAVGWFISLKLKQQEDRQMVSGEVAAMQAALSERLVVYENVLHGAAGLFAASRSVDRLEWRAYLDRVSIGERFPGIDAVGYVAWVDRADLDVWLNKTQADHAPEFQLRSPREAGELLIVKYLEPEALNGDLLGFDMGSDGDRRAIAERCRESGQAVISSQIRLENVGGGTNATGFLMFLPIYRNGAPIDTVDQRRANCTGLVYARFVTRQLMQEVLRRKNLPLRVQVFDYSSPVPDRIIFDTDAAATGYEPRIVEGGMIKVGGRTWVVQFSSTPEFHKQRFSLAPIMVGVGGACVSLLLFGIAWSLSHTRERAVAMAAKMTAKLRQANEDLKREVVEREEAQRSTKDSEALYHSLVETLPMCIVRKDLQGRFTFANQRYCQEVGRSQKEILGQTDFGLLPAEQAARHKQEEDRIIESGEGVESVQESCLPDAAPRFVHMIRTPLRDGAGKVIGLQVISWDVTDKHRTEQELQRERYLLHTLLDNIPDRVYFKDDQSRFLRVSRAMLDLFKVDDVSKVIGKSDFDFFGPEHAQQAYDDEQQIMRTGQPVIGLIEREDLPDGKQRWAFTTKMPMRDADGRVTGTFGISRDITRMKEAEQRIKDSEALYQSLVENLPLSIVRKDLEGRFTFANQHFCGEVGKTLDEVLGRTLADLFPPDFALQQQQGDDHVIKTGETWEGVQELHLPNNETRFVQMVKTPLRDGTGKVIGLLGIYWDVTDKHRAERELKHERHLLHMLLDNVPDRIYFKDRQSRFLRVSRAMLDLINSSKREGSETDLLYKEMLGKSDFDFFTAEHAQQAYEDEQRIIRTGEPIIGLVEKETLPGEIRWASSTKMPLRNEEGEIVGTFGITRDITDMKRASEALREAKEAAEEASRTKSQFLANMSHELRTPLNSIIGFSNILLKNKDGQLGQSALSFLSRILANGKHLLELINQILDLSKIEARRVELQDASIDLGQLVRETVEQQEGLIKERPVQLRCEVPDRVAPIVTDPDKLKQVLINLIGNALKFTEKGSVTLRLVADERDQRPVRIEVIDTGIGIPKDKLETVFKAFQQADATTARKFGGTGLGLTISQALCQLMGYQIEVSSEVGKGSTFTILLRDHVSHLAGRQAGESATRSPGVASPSQKVPDNVQGKRVLVIDDEADSRLLLRHTLREFGCHVIEASSGEEGLSLARQSHPHLITVDLMMPRMTGAEVVGAIKSDPELGHIPVVVVSIVSGEHRGHILGAVDLLQKPIVREELLATLERNLPATQRRILVVDDEEDSRELMRSLLELENFEVLTASGGQEGLDALAQSPCDLVLLDLMMPRMDGFAFLRTLRASPQLREVTVVVVTAKDLTSEEVNELRGNTRDVVKKSGDFERDLKTVLHRLFDVPAGSAT